MRKVTGGSELEGRELEAGRWRKGTGGKELEEESWRKGTGGRELEEGNWRQGTGGRNCSRDLEKELEAGRKGNWISQANQYPRSEGS